MKKVRALAWTTFHELVRERFFFVGVIVALILVVLSFLLGTLSFSESKRILFNLGTMAIELVTLSLGVFAGATLVSKEIELRTCQIILTRPLSRNHFLLGKWFGLVLFIICILISLGVLVFFLGGETFQKSSYIWILSEIALKSLLIMSAVFLFSLFLRPVLASLIGISIYLFGHTLEDIRFFLKRASEDQQVPAFFTLVEKVVPRFDLFNWKSFYFLERTFTDKQILLMFSHYLAWILFLVVLSLLSWRKKDIG